MIRKNPNTGWQVIHLLKRKTADPSICQPQNIDENWMIIERGPQFKTQKEAERWIANHFLNEAAGLNEVRP